MKVLIVCHDYEMSGANRSLYDWVSVCDKSKISISILIPKESSEIRRLFESVGCEVHVGHYRFDVKHLKEMSVAERMARVALHGMVSCWSVLNIPWLARWVKHNNYDLIHSNSFSCIVGAQVARKAQIPHVWHIREFMEEDHVITHWNRNLAEKLAKASTAIYISDVVKDAYQSKYEFQAGFVQYNRVNFDTKYHKNRAFMEDGTCRLLIAGTLCDGKGQRQAIAATNLLRASGYNVELDLYGSGHYEYIADLIPKKCDYIRYHGFTNDLVSRRADIDIALICSRDEAFGRVTVESLYYKNIVVASDRGCNPYLIKDGYNGFLYNYDDLNSLVESIKRCISAPELMDSIAERASKEAIEKYSTDISKNIIDIYRKC